MAGFNGIVSDPYWFDPVELMRSAVGDSDPRYVWWSQVVGRSLGVSLVNMVQLCELPEPAYPAETQENIDALGLSQFFRLWMVHYLWTIATA